MTSDAASVRVRVPATSANLGPGFDAFGLALALYDEVTVTVGAGSRVDIVGEGVATLPRHERHLVLRAFARGRRQWGGPEGPVALSCINGIPQGRGLGSSAAAVVAGLLAARLLAGPSGSAAYVDDDVRAAVLPLAVEMEGHPDNVAACVYGGVTLAYAEDAALRGRPHSRAPDGRLPVRLPGAEVRVVRLDAHPELRAFVFVPVGKLATEKARKLLPESVPHADAAHNAARAGLLSMALTTRPELLFDATEDRLHQQYRTNAMPESADLTTRLRRRAVPAVISGAGPSVLALTCGDTGAELQAAVADTFTRLPLELDRGGAIVR